MAKKLDLSAMLLPNISMIAKIHLLGFQSSQNLNYVLFTIFLIVYCLTLCGNLLMLTVLLTTVIAPSLLHVLLHKVGIISFAACIAQLFIFVFCEVSECFLLTVMSYDRYLAICNPLRYTTIMNHNLCLKLIVISWLLGFSVSTVEITPTSLLEFCGPNTIDHFFCDMPPLLELSCSDTSGVQLEIMLISAPVLLCDFIIIIMSYSYIIFVILKIPSSTGRQKAFSTCSSHLTVVSIFYGTIFGVYLLPTKGQSLNINKLLSLLYTVGTPLMNPVIYSLETHTSLKHLEHLKVISCRRYKK
ncbi:olfactory receptor 11L1-like [Bufo gargarizans]|uniref:olfactory receptor 11L1-like n=1 Tax=Bufo gargarizans TaxID=30331 RepID=UPI001CF1AE92|nr:olfactory receptor 11L1-like [Bufo gargarizans]